MKLNKPDNVEETKLYKEATDVKPTSVSPNLPDAKLTFETLHNCMNQFFDGTEYQVKQAYNKGYKCTVGEDYTNVDLLCNLSDIIYNYCNEHTQLSLSERKNLKSLYDGIQQIHRSISQYDSKSIDGILIATMMGYILKIARNYL